VEIASGEPFSVEDLLRTWAADGIQEQALELIIRDTVLLARTDIVVVLPELLWYLVAANTLEESSAVLYSSPLKHATDRYVEHDRVVVLEDSRVEDT
jgi:hypothetical protein